MRINVWLLLINLVAASFFCTAQDRQGNLSFVDENRLYIMLDRRWNDARKKEVATLFSLDTALVDRALRGALTRADSADWQAEQTDENLVQISKSLSPSGSTIDPGDVFLVGDEIFRQPLIFNPPLFSFKNYGLNKFGKVVSVTTTDSIAHFELPGYTDKNNVVLAGSFNNWSTSRLPMQKTGTGWQADVILQPGKYLYKFIADGFWMRDPNNKLKEGDNRSGYNSVFYFSNHVFRLEGHTNARKVMLAGSFNSWLPRDLKMNRITDGWELNLYLPEGTYGYKFIVDGQWITDPANPNTRPDANGNQNSFIGIGDTVLFHLAGYDTAHIVTVTGSFNNWDGSQLVMNKDEGGWSLPVVLGRGYYEYKFIVDGKWMPDPANPMTTGSGEYTNSCVWFKPNYTFRLKGFTDAKTVIVTGTFNGWRTDGYVMSLKDGEWQFPLFLKPGKYLYKFIVDGSWMIDPAGSGWEDNAEGTGNSVLWIE